MNEDKILIIITSRVGIENLANKLYGNDDEKFHLLYRMIVRNVYYYLVLDDQISQIGSWTVWVLIYVLFWTHDC